MTTPSAHQDLCLVAAMWQEHGLRLRRFRKEKPRTGKSPDFEVLDGEEGRVARLVEIG